MFLDVLLRQHRLLYCDVLCSENWLRCCSLVVSDFIHLLSPVRMLLDPALPPIIRRALTRICACFLMAACS